MIIWNCYLRRFVCLFCIQFSDIICKILHVFNIAFCTVFLIAHNNQHCFRTCNGYVEYITLREMNIL